VWLEFPAASGKIESCLFGWSVVRPGRRCHLFTCTDAGKETFMFRQCALLWTLIIGLQSCWVVAARAQTTEPAKVPAKEEPKKVAAKEATKEGPADPSGTWKWQYQFGDNKMDAKLKLNWDGKKLTGKYTARDATSDIHDAKLEKDQLSFTTVREINGNEFEIEFKGQVKQDQIVGKVAIDFGEAQEFDWDAKRSVEIDDVLGVWNLRIDTPNGLIEPKLTITKGDKDKLHGAYVSPFGEREPKNLALKDNQLSWEISSGDNDQFDFKIVYNGKPRGNVIEGTNEFEFGDNSGTMKFTGKRTPPEEKKKEQRPAEAKPTEAATSTEASKPAEATTPAAAESK
jgi:hypothetical protein